MEILDLKKIYKPFYSASNKQIEVVTVPCLNFLKIDGAIEPGQRPGTSPAFQTSLEALYGAAYTLKFMLKQRADGPLDYPVMPLEGLWTVRDGRFDIHIKDNWNYTVMILQPEQITPDLFAEGLAKLRKKKGDQPAFAQLRLETFEEGQSMQIMHLGPYADEPATVAKMDAFAAANGYHKYGDHHEIYLGDPMRADPTKLKTILRHAIRQ